MSNTSFPLGMPEDLLEEVKRIADETKLSVEDVMRQSMKLGLPHLRISLSKEEDFSESIAETWDKLGPAPTVLYDKL